MTNNDSSALLAHRPLILLACMLAMFMSAIEATIVGDIYNATERPKVKRRKGYKEKGVGCALNCGYCAVLVSWLVPVWATSPLSSPLLRRV